MGTVIQMVILIGLVVAALLVLTAIMRPWLRNCPRCRADIPAIRAPTSLRQMLWGGWTCPSCGLELDRKGNPVIRRTDVPQ